MTSDRVVVVGSGPCGAVAALELVRRGVPVTLLESGSVRPHGLLVKVAGHTVLRRFGSGTLQHDGGFTPELDPGTVWYRDLTPGGLSNYWTAAVPRFAPPDFGHGVDVDAVHRWPITYDDLAPRYAQVERLLDVTGLAQSTPNLPSNDVRFHARLPTDWADFVAPARTLGHDLVPLPMAKGRPWMLVRRGTEFNSWTAIIDRLAHEPAFEVRTGAHALRLRWARAAGRVDAIEYLDRRRGERVTLPGRAFVVAAGALNSTRLLQTSTSADFPTGLGDAHGVLGRYLHDHPKDWWMFETDRPLRLPAHPVYMTRCAPGRSDPLLATSWTIGLANRRDRPRTYVGMRGTRFAAQVFGTMVPDPDHRVCVDDGPVDDLGQRPMRIRSAYDEATRHTMRAARDRLREVLAGGSCSARPLVGPDVDLRPGESVHYGGTVRMHARPELGMVDGHGRLHAVPNVYVVDSSVFTTGPEKNPTLTAMAIAVHAMAALAGTLR